MDKLKIYIIASVSAMFVGFNVYLLLADMESALAIPMGISAGLGSMMIELVIPESLVSTWKSAPMIYKILAVGATLITPLLLIAALPDSPVGRFAVAFIAAALIGYVMFFVNEHNKTELAKQDKTAAESKAFDREMERLTKQNQLDMAAEKLRLQEDRRTKKALAQVAGTGSGGPDSSRESILAYIEQNPGQSWRGLGLAFGIDPKTVKARVAADIDSGLISVNGDGVKLDPDSL